MFVFASFQNKSLFGQIETEAIQKLPRKLWVSRGFPQAHLNKKKKVFPTKKQISQWNQNNYFVGQSSFLDKKVEIWLSNGDKDGTHWR